MPVLSGEVTKMATIAQAFRMESPDEIPLSIGILPAAWIRYGAELQRLTDQYPQFFHGRQVDYEHIVDHLSGHYKKGVWVDEV